MRRAERYIAVAIASRSAPVFAASTCAVAESIPSMQDALRGIDVMLTQRRLVPSVRVRRFGCHRFGRMEAGTRQNRTASSST